MDTQPTMIHSALQKRNEALEQQNRCYANLLDTLLAFEEQLKVTSSLGDLYGNIQKQIALIIPYQRFALLLVQADASYAIEAEDGASGSELNHITKTLDWLIDEGIFAQAVRHHRPIETTTPHDRALLSPLTHNDQVLGVILLIGSIAPDTRTISVLGQLTDKAGERIAALYPPPQNLKADTSLEGRLMTTEANAFDPLTGLLRREEWITRVSHQLDNDRNSGHSAAVLLLNLDGFWRMKQHFGTDTIDGIINYIDGQIRSILSEQLLCDWLDRSTDNLLIARTGLDEFAIYIPYYEELEGLDRMVFELHRQLTGGVVLDSTPIYVTASIGVSLYPANAIDTATLLQHADIALKHAKQTGRDKYSYYTKEMRQINVIGLGLEQQLHRALHENTFYFHYQPQVDIGNNRVTALEALLRMQSDSGELISPEIFIPLAEQIGLAHKIGAWGLRTVCRQIKAWQAAGFIRVPICVNLSAQQLNHPDLVDTYTAILHDEEIAPECIELEITETTLSHDEEQAVKNIHLLHEAGFRLVLDDFGTGYSTLASLSHLPIDGIKIDKLFIGEMGAHQPSKAIVGSLIEMARRLNIDIVAEGVETRPQLDQLKALGCPLAQGFLIARPAVADCIADEFLKPQ